MKNVAVANWYFRHYIKDAFDQIKADGAKLSQEINEKVTVLGELQEAESLEYWCDSASLGADIVKNLNNILMNETEALFCKKIIAPLTEANYFTYLKNQPISNYLQHPSSIRSFLSDRRTSIITDSRPYSGGRATYFAQLDVNCITGNITDSIILGGLVSKLESSVSKGCAEAFSIREKIYGLEKKEYLNQWPFWRIWESAGWLTITLNTSMPNDNIVLYDGHGKPIDHIFGGSGKRHRLVKDIDSRMREIMAEADRLSKTTVGEELTKFFSSFNKEIETVMLQYIDVKLQDYREKLLKIKMEF